MKKKSKKPEKEPAGEAKPKNNRWAKRFKIKIPEELHGLSDKVEYLAGKLESKRRTFEITSVKHAIVEGQYLLVAKEEVRIKYEKIKGIWGRYRKTLAKYDARTAQRYMDLARYVPVDSPLGALGQERLGKLISAMKTRVAKKKDRNLEAFLEGQDIDTDIDWEKKSEVVDLIAEIDQFFKKDPPSDPKKNSAQPEENDEGPIKKVRSLDRSVEKLFADSEKSKDQVLSVMESELRRFVEPSLVARCLEHLRNTEEMIEIMKIVLSENSKAETSYLAECLA